MERISIRNEIVKRNIMFCFILTPLVLFFLYFLVFPSSIPRFYQDFILFKKGEWLLSDFFFTLRSLLDGDPYGNREIYMPLTYLILYPFSQLYDYGSLTVEYDRVFLNECWSVPVGMVSYMFLLLIMSLLFWHSLAKLNWKHGLTNWSFVLLFFSSIFIFSIERGNLIILSAACVNYFLAYYENADKEKVYFALFSLVIATILKIYPAIFGLLLLKEKRYKDILFCIAIGIPLVFLPYLAFEGGFANIPIHLSNITDMQDEFSFKWDYFFGIPKFSNFLYDYILIDSSSHLFLETFLGILNLLLVLLSILIIFVGKEQYWKNVMLLSCVLILYPTNSGFYCGLYFFPVFCIFMGSKNVNKQLCFLIVVLSCILFNPFQVSVLEGFKLASIGSNLALITIWIILICSSLRHFIIDYLHGASSKKSLAVH